MTRSISSLIYENFLKCDLVSEGKNDCSCKARVSVVKVYIDVQVMNERDVISRSGTYLSYMAHDHCPKAYGTGHHGKRVHQASRSVDILFGTSSPGLPSWCDRILNLRGC